MVAASTIRVGDVVRVPWGTDEVDAEVVEVWGDPPTNVRVSIQLEEADEEPAVLLLDPKIFLPRTA